MLIVLFQAETVDPTLAIELKEDFPGGFCRQSG